MKLNKSIGRNYDKLQAQTNPTANTCVPAAFKRFVSFRWCKIVRLLWHDGRAHAILNFNGIRWPNCC